MPMPTMLRFPLTGTGIQILKKKLGVPNTQFMHRLFSQHHFLTDFTGAFSQKMCVKLNGGRA
jgi:hypothetical protein